VDGVSEPETSRFTGVYQEFYPRVLGYAMRRTTPDAAREVADETFLIAWRRRDVLPTDAVLPWLLVVARNVLSDQRRRGRRQDALRAEIADASLGRAEPGVDAAVIERITVLTALAALPSTDREVLMLTVWDGLSRDCSPGRISAAGRGTRHRNDPRW
jgi:RNA polymerase sigma-70 factor, ECF subfamily